MIVAGVTPRTVVEPPTVAALAQCVAELYARGESFAAVGGETQLDLGNAPRALETVVKTTACNRVIEYAPADQTITVEAGMTLAQIAQTLAEKQQFLALDAALPERTTIGGAIATNLYGRRRLRYGAIKDSIVGVEMVRPDGTRARGGGKVVKNVAGFDIPKLMVGSLGTLGAIVRATLRVYPLEERRAAVVYRGVDISQIMQIASELVAERLVPASVIAYDVADGVRYDCVASFEGFARGVEAQIKAATSIAVRLGASAGAFDGPLLGSFDEPETAVRGGLPWRVRVAAAPTALAAFLAAGEWTGLRRVVYPLLGSAFATAPALDAATIARWRAALAGGSVVVEVMPPAARAEIETWGAPPAAFAIMRRMKTEFDPKDLCNAGRFIGGI